MQNLLWFAYMYQAALQERYSDDRRVWNALFEMVVNDFAAIQKDGVPYGTGGSKFWPIILGNKGDWSYLVPGLVLKGFSDFLSIFFLGIISLATKNIYGLILHALNHKRHNPRLAVQTWSGHTDVHQRDPEKQM